MDYTKAPEDALQHDPEDHINRQHGENVTDKPQCCKSV